MCFVLKNTRSEETYRLHVCFVHCCSGRMDFRMFTLQISPNIHFGCNLQDVEKSAPRRKCCLRKNPTFSLMKGRDVSKKRKQEATPKVWMPCRLIRQICRMQWDTLQTMESQFFGRGCLMASSLGVDTHRILQDGASSCNCRPEQKKAIFPTTKELWSGTEETNPYIHFKSQSERVTLSVCSPCRSCKVGKSFVRIREELHKWRFLSFRQYFGDLLLRPP